MNIISMMRSPGHVPHLLPASRLGEPELHRDRFSYPSDESILSVRVRTLIALILSRTLDCVYEWSGWVNWALEAGLPQETVDAIRERRTPPHPTPEDSLVMDFCAQLMTGSHRVNDATYKAALDHFGTQGVVELVTTLGYFAMIAYPLNAFEIRLSAEQVRMREPVDLNLPI